MTQQKPRVRILSTGGTIASTEDVAEGAAAYKNYAVSERASDLLASVPQLDTVVEAETEELLHEESPKLSLPDYVQIARATQRAAADGVDGVVITHGTSAIEETAVFCDLVLDSEIPVVFVGAMRPADAIDADGPANMLTAARLIASGEFHWSDRPSGVYVVMNGTVHAARDVTKADSWATNAFDSGPPGPVARFTDEELQLYREPGSRTADLSKCNLHAIPDMTVPIVTTCAGAEATLIEQAVEGALDADGFVVETTGRGGTSPDITQATEEAVQAGIPVVKSTRCHHGPVKSSGASGGIIGMENLPAWKARIHLIVALTLTRDSAEIHELFAGSKQGVPVTPPAEL